MKRRPSGPPVRVHPLDGERGLGFGLIGEDEPVFIVRGRDLAAPETIETWARVALAHGAHPTVVAHAGQWAKRVRDWQRVHGGRIPREGP